MCSLPQSVTCFSGLLLKSWARQSPSMDMLQDVSAAFTSRLPIAPCRRRVRRSGTLCLMATLYILFNNL